jgi:hypothetical protein
MIDYIELKIKGNDYRHILKSDGTINTSYDLDKFESIISGFTASYIKLTKLSFSLSNTWDQQVSYFSNLEYNSVVSVVYPKLVRTSFPININPNVDE